MPTLELSFAQPVTADPAARRLTGVAVPYGVASNPTGGDGRRYRFAGPPANIDEHVDAVREHDPEAVVGRVETWDQGTDALGASVRPFTTTAGNDVMIEASEGVRPAFSIGADAQDCTLAPDGVYDVGTWTARHLGIVRRPAFAAAQISRIAASESTPPEDDEDEDDDVTHDADAEPEEEGDVPEQEQTTPIDAGRVPTQHHRGRSMQLTLSGAPAPRTFGEASAALALSAQHRGVTAASDAAEINAALADITPAPESNGLAGAFLRPQWLGELWTPEYAQRNLIDAIGTTPLTSMTWQGWKWGERPEVDKYAGNKAEIPTNPVSIVPATGTAYRVAGGWDVDRVFLDLGSPDFIEALFSAAIADYRRKSEDWCATDLLAGASVAAPPPASLVEAIDVLARTLAINGADLDFIGMSTDLWSGYLALGRDEVPWWLANQATVNISSTTTDVAGIRVVVNHALPTGTLLGGDRDAVDFRDTGPIRVQAVNLPNGGVDIGVFGYQGTLVQDNRGLVKTTVTPAGGAAASSSSKSK